MTHIDIRLITYNRPQLLALTLKSLAQQDIVSYAPWQEQNIAMPLLGLGGRILERPFKEARQ